MDVTYNISRLNGFSGSALITIFIVHMLFMCFPHSYLDFFIIEQNNDRLDDNLTLRQIISWIDICFFWRPWQEIVKKNFGNQFHCRGYRVPLFKSTIL